jgi:nucleotide-binding universal stress UspA family protein
MLIATAGVLSPDPVADFAERLIGEDGAVAVLTVIEVPRSFLDTIRSEQWHPLAEGSPAWSEEEDAVIERYVEERGRRLTDPILAALRARRIEPHVMHLEGEDPATTIIEESEVWNADVVVLGATKHLFDEWESVSARVMRELGRPVLVVPSTSRPDAEEDELETG